MFLAPSIFTQKNIMNAKEKHVYLFSELDQAEAYTKDGWDSVRGLFRGKGANLAT